MLAFLIGYRLAKEGCLRLLAYLLLLVSLTYKSNWVIVSLPLVSSLLFCQGREICLLAFFVTHVS